MTTPASSPDTKRGVDGRSGTGDRRGVIGRRHLAGANLGRRRWGRVWGNGARHRRAEAAAAGRPDVVTSADNRGHAAVGDPEMARYDGLPPHAAALDGYPHPDAVPALVDCPA